MNNPFQMMMLASVNAMMQYVQLTQSMMTAFLPAQGQSQQPKPALVPAKAPAKLPAKRMGCIGPADLNS